MHLVTASSYPYSMADVHDRATRSYNMSRIKGKDTKPEMPVHRLLHANGFRYKLHDKTLPGKPGIVLPKYKPVIFIHACLPVGRVVSGMDMKAAKILCCTQSPGLSGG